MNVADERTKSSWMEFRLASAPALSSDARADVAVIGSGIAGLSVAYELAAVSYTHLTLPTICSV